MALEYGQAMTVRVRRADAPEAPMRESGVTKGGGAGCSAPEHVQSARVVPPRKWVGQAL